MKPLLRFIRNPIERDIAQLEWNIESVQFWLAKYEAGMEPERVVIKGHPMPIVTREQEIARCKVQIERFRNAIKELKEAQDENGRANTGRN